MHVDIHQEVKNVAKNKEDTKLLKLIYNIERTEAEYNLAKLKSEETKRNRDFNKAHKLYLKYDEAVDVYCSYYISMGYHVLINSHLSSLYAKR